jgi:hypothetical protein
LAARPAKLLAILLAVAGCVDDVSTGEHVPQEQVAGIRLLGFGVALPRSATNVWRNEKSFLDAYQMLRFDAPLADAQTFARSILGRDTVPGEDPYFQAFGHNYEWWLHDYPDGARGGSRLDANPTVKVVLVPRGERARVRILLFRM